jgi:hypothetical protein
MAIPDTTKTLTTIIEALKPLDSAERHRTVNAAMLFLGEVAQTATAQRKPSTEAAGRDIIDGSYPAAVKEPLNKSLSTRSRIDP